MLRLLILLAFTTSCGAYVEYSIDPELNVFVEEFYADAERHGKTPLRERHSLVVVEYADLKATVAGTCYEVYAYGQATHLEIRINTLYQKYSDNFKRRVMYHEMAHCMFDMPHIDDGEASLMNSSILDSYGRSFDELVTQLFTEEL